MRRKSTLTITSISLALVAITSLGVFRSTTRSVQAQDAEPQTLDRYSFGMVGLTQGQTLRVNVSNVIANNDPNFPPGPSRVAIIVVNSRGEVLRTRDGSLVRKVELLERGDSTFLDFNTDDIQWPPGPTRLQVRGVVNAWPPGPSNVAIPYDSAVPSVEVFNNANNRTVIFMGNPGVIRGFNPQPDPPL